MEPVRRSGVPYSTEAERYTLPRSLTDGLWGRGYVGARSRLHAPERRRSAVRARAAGCSALSAVCWRRGTERRNARNPMGFPQQEWVCRIVRHVEGSLSNPGVATQFHLQPYGG